MATPTIDLLLHPVRMRIVNALSAGPLTTADLVARLGEFGQATVYRHVARLARAGVIGIDGERRIGRRVERQYRLRPDTTRIPSEAGATMTLSDHRRGFTATMAALLAEFGGYLDLAGANPFADEVSYRQATVWLDERERAALIERLRGVLMASLRHQPSPGRLPHRFSLILFPMERPNRGRRPRAAARRR